MKLIESPALDFSDVLLIPKRSELGSRKEVNLEREFIFKHSQRKWKGIPIMASNMDTVGTIEMALEFQKHKMFVCLHKYYTADQIPPADVLNRDYFALTTGIVNIEQFYPLVDQVKPHFVCIDVANGYSSKFIQTVKDFHQKYPNITLIAGNVVTKEITEELVINCGVDIVKVGIGSGANCTTRLKTGVGIPQITAIIDCSDAAHGLDAHIISDGGIRCVGDIGKAFGANTDFVMCGSMFSKYFESGGDIYFQNNKIDRQKVFKLLEDDPELINQMTIESYGMSSRRAMMKYEGKVANYRTDEGIVKMRKLEGKVENQILDILGGLRSTGTYIGARSLKNFGKCATFRRVNKIIDHSL